MYPQQPQYPAQYPQQQIPQQYPQQFPQQPGHFPAPPPAQPQQPLATGSLDDFYNQPSSGGGKALNFEQVGTSYIGMVARPLNNGDIQQQTDANNRPLTFRDGRPKFVMLIPLQSVMHANGQPSAAHPDGLGVWWVKGQARDELNRAMAEAGAPEGPPEAGAVIQVTCTGARPSGAGFNPTKLYAVVYRRPDGAAPVAPVAAPAAQPIQQIAQPAQQAAPVVTAQPPNGGLAAPPELSPAQQELLAKLKGAQPSQ